MMFILLYKDQDYDDCTCEVLYCSSSREALEKKRSSIEGDLSKFAKECKIYDEKMRKLWEKINRARAEWIEENKDAILLVTKSARWPSLPRNYYGYYFPVDKLSAEQKEQARPYFMRMFQQGNPPTPWDFEDFIDEYKIKSPIPTWKSLGIELPKANFPLYPEGTLLIKEVDFLE